MTISASKRVVLVDYFLRKNRYNIMLWALFTHILKTRISVHTPDRVAVMGIIQNLSNALFKSTFQSNWNTYVHDTHTEKELGDTFFERELFTKVSAIVTPQYEADVLKAWQGAEWGKRPMLSKQLFGLTVFSEMAALLELRKTRISPWIIRVLYKDIWNEVYNFYPSTFNTKLDRFLLNHFNHAKDLGLLFTSSIGFCLYVLLTAIQGTELRKRIDQIILYIGGPAGAIGALVLFIATLLFFHMILPFYEKIQFNSISRALTSNKGSEINHTDFLPELFFMGLIAKLVDELTPSEKSKKSKQLPATKSGTSHSATAASVRTSAVLAPVPVLKEMLEEKSLLAQAGFGRIFEATQFELSAHTNEPVVAKDIIFYCHDSDGIQRRVYPFKNIFVADILPEQTDDEAARARITAVLQDGNPLAQGQKGKSGFKLYSTGSEAPNPRGAADGVLKVDRKIRVICSAHRVDVVGDDAPKNAIVYFPKIIASKTSFKFSRPA